MKITTQKYLHLKNTEPLGSLGTFTNHERASRTNVQLLSKTEETESFRPVIIYFFNIFDLVYGSVIDIKQSPE